MPMWKIISVVTALILVPPILFVGMVSDPFTLLLYFEVVEAWVGACVFAAAIYYFIIRPRLND